jgi:hypothetical protein
MSLKVIGWGDAAEARRFIADAIARARQKGMKRRGS